MFRFISCLVISCVVLLPVAARAQQHEHPAAPAERLGKVHFETSCNASVRDAFDRAVALCTRSGRAVINAFTDVQKTPGRPMAHWGIALGIWGNAGGTRTPQTMERGRKTVEQAKAAARRRSASGVHRGRRSPVCRRREQFAHARAYKKDMTTIVAKNPKDTEAAVFHAIALDAAADPADKTYAKQLQAARRSKRSWRRSRIIPASRTI